VPNAMLARPSSDHAARAAPNYQTDLTAVEVVLGVEPVADGARLRRDADVRSEPGMRVNLP